MNINLLCGRGSVPITLPDSVILVETKAHPVPADPAAAVRAGLDHPINSRPLLELARRRRRACLVVSDLTRPVPNRIILPAILETLHQAGLKAADITILIATGMHAPLTGIELNELLGSEIVATYPVVNHDCHDQSRNIQVAEFEGHSIEIDRIFLEADLKIATGLIEPHHIAGYSGGGKSILPGLASFNSMKFMHAFAMLQDPRVRTINLADNPFQQYVRRAAQAAGLDFIVNVFINKSREICAVFSGELEAAHNEGCRVVEDHAVAFLDEPVDLVVASAAGYPLDATFYQACKGYISARDALRPGGRVLLVAGCHSGVGGEEFCRMINPVLAPEDFFAYYGQEQNFTVDQWAAQRYYQALAHCGEMFLFAPSLPPETLAGLGLTRVENLQETVDRLLHLCPRTMVVPEGPYVTVQVRSNR
jgi:nickel-dependent lactate racemase